MFQSTDLGSVALRLRTWQELITEEDALLITVRTTGRKMAVGMGTNIQGIQHLLLVHSGIYTYMKHTTHTHHMCLCENRHARVINKPLRKKMVEHLFS